LYKNNFNRFIEIYILKYNPNSSAVVLGTLIDLECDENYIKQILDNLIGNCQMETLI
jgi:clathrin heavy chain